jgi:AcrR family transcriptional regulator
MDETVGLRERKKQRTREQIVEAAMRLFAERGYEATTIADIAAAADIAPRTFFGYFPSKEAVVFHDADQEFEGLAAALAARPDGEYAFTALRGWIDDQFRTGEIEHEAQHVRKQLCSQSEELQRVQHGLMARFEELLRGEIARDLDEPADALRPRLVAAATMAALRSLSDHPDHSREDGIAVLDEALAFLQAGIEGLQRGEAGVQAARRRPPAAPPTRSR